MLRDEDLLTYRKTTASPNLQVSNWFANARRRLKSTVSSAVTNDWASRINQYNDYIVGKQEMLSDTDADEAAANPTGYYSLLCPRVITPYFILGLLLPTLS